ncbi:MAG: NAD(P)/FAD-dependent oxidoreductase [Alphaproteobacteria bacterium]|nr:NAD(P)/FAD-dependent oxidoreductase [Alphaproteobacteria bacterium]
MKHVILGAGPGGVIAAETLSKQGHGGAITLVGDEPEPPYSRMAIPYLLSDIIDESGTYLRKNPDHYEKLGIDRLQARASGIDTKKGRVALDNGKELPYDRLLIATGSSATTPPIEGLDGPGVHHCWTLEDTRHILKSIEPGSEVLLMGAGFVACIILNGLVKRGAKVTAIVRGPRMVRSMMTETAGGMIKRWCGEKGIRVLTETNATRVTHDGGLKVDLDNSETMNPALIIVAVGVKPNMDFIDGSGIETDYGILVDNHMQTNIEGIFATGDVAQGLDFSSGGRSVHAIQPTASEHGRIAALNMAGVPATYKGSLLMNVLDTVGLIATSFGQWQGAKGGDHAEAVDEDHYKYLRLEFEEDRLVGACSVGITQHVGAVRGLIQSRTRLGHWKKRLVQDPTRFMEAYLGSTQPVG